LPSRDSFEALFDLEREKGQDNKNLPVFPVSLSCIASLSLLELKGCLKILHSLRSKAPLNL
ncbi:hypothetical protein HGM15179_017143, partial [Zosterops borbonicus]